MTGAGAFSAGQYVSEMHSPTINGDTSTVSKGIAQPGYGEKPSPMREVFSDEQREIAIRRAAHLVEFFQAERECFEALYRRDGCFTHKGAADAAKLNQRKAAELLAALILAQANKAS